ncbi:MAG: hypothetical protein EXS35_12300 [Pedosphaera sp.]|nr:hypothetical protein [Pedosphaera sp.]
MPLTELDRTVLEVRELLVTTQDRDKVVRVLKNRGMDEAEAAALVLAVYKQNRWENRKLSLFAAIGSGAIVAVLLVVWFTTGRLFYVWLPLAALACLWSTIKCCTATGYQLEEADDD